MPASKSHKSANEAAVARLREMCMAFPEANERMSHGEPTWFAGKGKVFAMLDYNHHGAEHLSVWLPQPLGVQELLVSADPDLFFRPPYVGPSGWVGVVMDRKPDWSMIARLVRDAYLHVATKKLVAQLDVTAVGTRTPARGTKSGAKQKPRARSVTPRRR